MILRRIHHIVTLARSTSYVSASQKLNLTQSALTKSIQAFEEEFAVRIFDRGRAGVSLTAAGREMIGGMEDLLVRAKTLENEILSRSDEFGGSIRFGMNSALAAFVLEDLLHTRLSQDRMNQHHIYVDSEKWLTEKLLSEDLDFFFSEEKSIPASDRLRIERLGTLPTAFLVRAEHPLRNRENITPADIEKYPLIGGSFREKLAPKGLPRSEHYFPMIGCDNNDDMMRRLTLSSNAIWTAARYSADIRNSNGREELFEIELPWLNVPESVMIVRVTLHDKKIITKSSDLLEEISEALRKILIVD